MSVWGRLYRAEQQFDFPALWKRALVVSAAIVLVSLGSLVFRGLNLGIEFEGGTSWEVLAPDTTVAQTREALSGTGAAAGKIQTIGIDSIRVRADIDDADSIVAVTTVLAGLAGVNNSDVSVTTVGPSWGDQITSKARNALIWFFVIVAIYIAIRLEWRMSLGALVAVAHDIIISVGLYSLFQFEVTPATVIAFLTIMGYSLYDTIVVYDKVREIGRKLGPTERYTYTEMMNLALNQVLMRSINTSITSVLPVLSMLIVGSLFLGALTLQEFAVALLIGILVGSYSSIFVAAALVALIKEREAKNLALARKVRLRAGEHDGTRMIATENATVGATRTRPTADRVRPANTPPRPRKKKKKR
ncbi:MAG: protein translocase subunit SecF [Acidimicrobiaceae bacterium]|nr:protein translocase subunit SecF [Acidimicrobiaceae bacterium]